MLNVVNRIHSFFEMESLNVNVKNWKALIKPADNSRVQLPSSDRFKEVINSDLDFFNTWI